VSRVAVVGSFFFSKLKKLKKKKRIRFSVLQIILFLVIG